MLRSEVEDKSVRTAADFNHARIRCDWLKRLEEITHTPRRSHHRANDLVFAPANVFRLALLVSKLALKRPLRKLPSGGLSPDHIIVRCMTTVGAALRGRPNVATLCFRAG